MVKSARAFEQPDEAIPSALDRRIDLTRVSGEAVAWVAVFLLGALLRLVERTTWPLSAGEAQLASDALALVRGGTLSTAASARPLPTDLTAFAMFLFGPSDGIARLVPAVAGLATILLVIALRPWLGSRAALCAGAIAALSPTLGFASRRLDTSGVLALGMLLLIVVLLRQLEQPSDGGAVAVGIATGLLLLSGPLGWIAVPLTFLAALAMARILEVRSRDLPLASLALVVTVVLLTTALFTRPGGFSAFFVESLRALWSEHLVTLGAAWHLVPLVLVVDELLALVMGLYAVWVISLASDRLPYDGLRPARGLLTWTAVAVVLATLLGGKNAEVYVLAVVPLVLLGGMGLGSIIATVDWSEAWSARGLAFWLAAFLTLAAALSAFGLLTEGAGTNPGQWVFTTLVVVVLIFLPLVLLTVWIARRMEQSPSPLLGLGLTVVLGALALQSSIMLGATNIDRPGEPLLAGSTTPDVTVLVGRLERLSGDLTTFQQDVRDPAGGHGLTIVIDDAIAQPFAWYFRDYPNLKFVTPGSDVTQTGSPQVIIALPSDAGRIVPANSGYVERQYALKEPLPPGLAAPNWGSLFAGLLDPNQVRRDAGFLVDRQVTQPGQPETFVLALRSDLARLMWGQ